MYIITGNGVQYARMVAVLPSLHDCISYGFRPHLWCYYINGRSRENEEGGGGWHDIITATDPNPLPLSGKAEPPMIRSARLGGNVTVTI